MDTGWISRQRPRREAKFRATRIDLEFFHSAAAADDRRAPDLRRGGARHGAQRIAPQVQEIRDPRREPRIGTRILFLNGSAIPVLESMEVVEQRIDAALAS